MTIEGNPNIYSKGKNIVPKSRVFAGVGESYWCHNELVYAGRHRSGGIRAPL